MKPFLFLRKVYYWTVDFLGRRASPVTLAAVAFAEASFFPIPPEVLLLPMCLARPRRAFFFAGITTMASVSGAFLGYIIGHYFMGTVGIRVIDFFHLHEEFSRFQSLYSTHGVYIVFLAAFTPLPYKVFTIASGAVKMDVFLFLAASLTGRGSRYFLLATPFSIWGEKAGEFVEKNFEKVVIGASMVIVVVFVLWRLR